MSTPTASPQGHEQLTLLSSRDLPVQFRLDQRTRQRGLAHIAALKAQLAAHTESAPRPARTAPRRRAA